MKRNSSFSRQLGGNNSRWRRIMSGGRIERVAQASAMFGAALKTTFIHAGGAVQLLVVRVSALGVPVGARLFVVDESAHVLLKPALIDFHKPEPDAGVGVFLKLT